MASGAIQHSRLWGKVGCMNSKQAKPDQRGELVVESLDLSGLGHAHALPITTELLGMGPSPGTGVSAKKSRGWAEGAQMRGKQSKTREERK